MELKDFIKKVVIDIEKARKEINIETEREYTYSQSDSALHKWWIDFDLTVASEDSSWWTWWAKIEVLGFMKVWWDLDTNSKLSSSNRIKFSLYTDNF